MANPEVAIIIKAKDQASSVLSGIGDKLGGLGTMAIAGAAVGVAALAGLGVAAFKLGADFDAAYDKIQIKTGATGEVLQGLKADFKAVYASVPSDMGLVSSAVSELSARLGLVGEPLQRMSTQFLELSRITETDLSTNIAGATRMFGDWSIASDEQSDALDKVFRASQLTGAGIEGLMQRVVQFGAPLRALGFEFDDSVAMLAKWEKEGVNVDTVLASLKIAVGKFAKAEAEGTGTGKTAKENLWDTFDAIKGNTSEMKAMVLGMEIFGTRAGPDMVMAIREGRFEFEDLVKALEASTGAIMETGAQTMDAGEKFELMKHKVNKALEPITSRIFDLVGALADKLMPYIDKVTGWIETKLVPAFDKVGPVVSLIGGLISRLFGGESSAQVNQFLVPLSGVVSVLGEIGKTIMEKVSPFIAEMQVKFAKFVEFLKPLMGPAWANIKSAMTNIVKFFKENWDKVEKIFDGVWKVIQGIVKVAWDVVSGIIKIGMSLLAGDWDKAWTALKDMLSGIWEDIKLVIRGATDVIGATLGLAWEGMKTAARWAWEGIRDNIFTIVNWIIDHSLRPFIRVINDAIYGLNCINAPWAKDIGYVAEPGHLAAPPAAAAPPSQAPMGPFGPPEIPYQFGGIVRGPIGMPVRAIVHGGEEILTPRDRGRATIVNYFNFDFKGADLGGLTQEHVEEIVKEATLQQRLQGIR